MIDLVAFISFISIFFLVILDSIRTKYKLRQTKSRLLQETADRIILINKLNDEISKGEDVSVEKTDGFLNFITQSRDWAFSYIEEVQEGISNFVSSVEDDISYLAEYSPPIVDLEMQKRLVVAYSELKKLLPEEGVLNEKE